MPLSSHMPELRALEALAAVVDAGSFHAAAERLGVSQQAVSARIANLEAVAGVQLLNRSSHGSRPTPAGTVAVEWSSRLLEIAHEIDTGLAALRQESRTRIRVSASLTVAEQLLPGWLVSLRAEAESTGGPALDVMLTATNSDHVLEQVRSGEADLGFVEGPSVPRGVRSRVVARDTLVLVVPRSHPWAKRSRPVPARTLAGTALITRESGSGTRDFLSRALGDALGADIHQAAPAMQLSSSAAVRAAVIAGAGPAVMSRLVVADDLDAGRLHEVRVDLPLRRALRAVWTGPATPPAGAVRDLLTHIASVGHRLPKSGRRDP